MRNMNIRKLILVVLFSSLAQVGMASDNCDELFLKNKLQSSDPDCDIKCASVGPLHLGDFICPLDCEKFCAKRDTKREELQKCQVSEAWKRSVRDNQISFKNSHSIPFTKEEREKVYESLSEISVTFPISNLRGIYKIAKPDDPFDLFTPATYSDKNIILYNRAFRENENLTRILVHELSHYLHETKLKKEFKSYTNSTRSLSMDAEKSKENL